MKSLALIFACLVSVSASAQQGRHDDDIRMLAQQVNMLVQNNLRALPGEHRQYVRESLQGILQSFAMNGVNINVGGSLGPLPPPPPPVYQQPRQLICDSSNNVLMDLTSGRMVHDFASAYDCTTAKEQVQRGEAFCDSSDNKLYSAGSRMIYDFASSYDCQTSRESVNRGRGFCDSSNNTLHRADGSLVYDFASQYDCQNALSEMR